MTERRVRANQTNVETLFAFYRAVNRGNREKANQFLADSLKWAKKTEDGPPKVYTEPESVLRNCFSFLEDENHVQIVPEQVHEDDELLMVTGEFVGLSPTDDRFHSRFEHLYEIRNGRISHVESADGSLTVENDSPDGVRIDES